MTPVRQTWLKLGVGCLLPKELKTSVVPVQEYILVNGKRRQRYCLLTGYRHYGAIAGNKERKISSPLPPTRDSLRGVQYRKILLPQLLTLK